MLLLLSSTPRTWLLKILPKGLKAGRHTATLATLHTFSGVVNSVEGLKAKCGVKIIDRFAEQHAFAVPPFVHVEIDSLAGALPRSLPQGTFIPQRSSEFLGHLPSFVDLKVKCPNGF